VGYNPSYNWINPTYPIYNRGYNPLTKWDEPPSSLIMFLVYPYDEHPWNGVSYVGLDQGAWPMRQ